MRKYMTLEGRPLPRPSWELNPNLPEPVFRVAGKRAYLEKQTFELRKTLKDYLPDGVKTVIVRLNKMRVPEHFTDYSVGDAYFVFKSNEVAKI